MSLVFDRGDTTLLNPAEISGKIGLKTGRVEVGDLAEVLDFAIFTLLSSRWDVAKDRRVLGVRPVRELVVVKNEIGTVGGVVIVDNSVPTNELL